jgi:hypothetical protein
LNSIPSVSRSDYAAFGDLATKVTQIDREQSLSRQRIHLGTRILYHQLELLASECHLIRGEPFRELL